MLSLSFMSFSLKVTKENFAPQIDPVIYSSQEPQVYT